MKLNKTKQVEIDDLKAIKFDLILTSSGFESRARFLVESFDFSSKFKFSIGFDKHKEKEERINSDSFFSLKGYESKESSGNDETVIIEILDHLVNSKNEGNLNILVDYSSMTRVWYAALLKYFYYSNLNFEEVNIFFSYSCGKFLTPPTSTIYNRFVGPIDGFYTLSIPNKPTALIIGLGYVESRAYGLSEYFDVNPYLFVADGSSSEQFYNEVISNNKELINSVGDSKLYLYPLKNMAYTETLLFHFCAELLTNYRVVLAPCGPKPFTLLSLIVFLRFNNIDVWRISAGDDEEPMDRMPSGDLVIYQASLIG